MISLAVVESTVLCWIQVVYLSTRDSQDNSANMSSYFTLCQSCSLLSNANGTLQLQPVKLGVCCLWNSNRKCNMFFSLLPKLLLQHKTRCCSCSTSACCSMFQCTCCYHGNNFNEPSEFLSLLGSPAPPKMYDFCLFTSLSTKPMCINPIIVPKKFGDCLPPGPCIHSPYPPLRLLKQWCNKQAIHSPWPRTTLTL